MDMKPVLTNEVMVSLAKRLEAIPSITQNDKADRQEAWTLAHAFMDLEEAFRAFLDEQLPRLGNPDVQGDDLLDAVMDSRELFRHILYHLHDPEYFRVMEPTHDWLTVQESANK